MNLRDWCLDQIDYDEELMFADGFDDAILGVTYQNGHSVVLYDRERCIDILMTKGAADREEAEEFFDFNVAGTYIGPRTPLFITMPKKEDVTTLTR